MYATQLKNITTKHQFDDWCMDLNESSAFKRNINSTPLRVSQCPYNTCMHAEFKKQKFNLFYYTGNKTFSSLCHILCVHVQNKTVSELESLSLADFKDVLDFYELSYKIAFQRVLNHVKILARKLSV